MSLPRSRFISCLLAGACALAAPAVAWAQAYPERPVKLVIPFAPGGATDILGRLLATAMAERLGQPMVVENWPGAGTVVAASLVAKAPADGYTLLLGANTTLTMNPAIRTNLPYDPVRSFTPIGIRFRPLTPTEIAERDAERAEELLGLLGLGEGRERFAAACSYGMRKKTAFAMALLHRPKLLLLDEPFEGLDPASCENVLALLLRATRTRLMQSRVASSALSVALGFSTLSAESSELS